MCIAITSAIGRILFGKLSDFKWVNSIFLQQVTRNLCIYLLFVRWYPLRTITVTDNVAFQLSFVVIGTVSILIPLMKDYNSLLRLTFILGLFDGCFITVVGPIAFKFCGPKGAGQAIGFLLGLISIPITIGPTVAGMYLRLYLIDERALYVPLRQSVHWFHSS